MVGQNGGQCVGPEASQKTLGRQAKQLPYLQARKPAVSEGSRKHPASTLFFYLFGRYLRTIILLSWGRGKIVKQKATASLSADLCVEKVRLCELDILTCQAYLISIFISAGSLPIV